MTEVLFRLYELAMFCTIMEGCKCLIYYINTKASVIFSLKLILPDVWASMILYELTVHNYFELAYLISLCLFRTHVMTNDTKTSGLKRKPATGYQSSWSQAHRKQVSRVRNHKLRHAHTTKTLLQCAQVCKPTTDRPHSFNPPHFFGPVRRKEKQEAFTSSPPPTYICFRFIEIQRWANSLSFFSLYFVSVIKQKENIIYYLYLFIPSAQCCLQTSMVNPNCGYEVHEVKWCCNAAY